MRNSDHDSHYPSTVDAAYVYVVPWSESFGNPNAGKPPEALCGGIPKVNFKETLSSFGDKCPQNGSKNGLRAPRTGMGYPYIGPFVGYRL